MKIKKVEIEGFRAYKYKQDGTFDFIGDADEPSNFVAIHAPNGFGKSSFFDAIEWAFTANIERYILDHNRKNNELAARGTKQDGIPQSILRNKYIEEGMPTSVNVITTSRPYYRTLGKTRADSRDLKYRKDDTEKGTEFFRNIILSQDAIDSFLSEVKPKERYNLFMEHFGGDTERLRQEITVLLNDNSNILVGLHEQRIDLEKQLEEPVDELIFSAFNEVAASLNENGESVMLASREFTESTEHLITSSIVTRSHELVSICNTLEVSHKMLDEQLKRLPEIQGALDSIVSQNTELEKLTKGSLDAQRYEGFLNSYSKCIEDLQSTNQQYENLKEIEKYSPSYIQAEKNLTIETQLQNSLNNKKLEKEAALNILDLSAKKYNEDLSTHSKRKLDLETLRNGCSSIYSEISINQEHLLALKSELSSKANKVVIDTADYNNIADKITKISKVEVVLETLLTADVSLLNLDDDVFFRIKIINEKLNSLEIQEQSICRTQETLNQQAGVIERLVSLGLEYMSTTSSRSTDTCPLCQSQHPSADELRKAMETNALVSDLIKNNANNLEQLNFQKKELQDQLEAILSEVTKKKYEYISELQLKLNELSSRIAGLGREIVLLKAKVVSVQEYIESNQNKVWNLKQKDLVLRINMEIGELTVAYDKKLEQFNADSIIVETLKSELFSINSDYENSKLKVKGITSQEYYEKVQGFLDFSGILLSELYSFRSQRVDETRKEILTLTELRDRITFDSNTLKSEMSADGTWFDFSALNKQKSSMSETKLNLELFINTFFESVDEVLGKTASRNIEGVQNELSQSIKENLSSVRELRNKISKYELLSEQLRAFKPYVLSLELRKALAGVEQNISEHMGVEKVLSKELEVIFKSLRERIGGFFYTDLINSIYGKIDPHPSFKKVDFVPEFDESNSPKLNIIITDDNGDIISPSLYFSSAQLNILSLSVFLARALHAKDNDGVSLDVILIDDPIQSMDSINVLAMIDLLRNISVKFDKQIIISTHDENFFGLLQRKIPTEVLGSKFLTLESFGVVSPAEVSIIY